MLGGAKDAVGQAAMLYQVDTEKLLHSTDKVTITDLWKSVP